MARKYESTYRIRETDDVLVKENAIHQDLDMRLDAVEQAAQDMRDGNRLDVDALVRSITEDFAEKSAAVEQLIEEQQEGFTPDRIQETTEKRFTSDVEQQAHIDALQQLAEDTSNALGSKVNSSTFVSHRDNHENPHGVTKEQVGLGNVDNTPDTEKPVSAPQQEALNNRLRIDALQSLTAAQQGQAWVNIGGSRQNDDRIINGDFSVWQRGNSHSTLGYGSADRWANLFSGGTVVMSKAAFGLTENYGGTTPLFALFQNVSGQSAANHFAIIGHRIEDVRSYAGQTITVLGWALRSSGAGNMVVEAEQVFGTGGSPSSAVAGISPTTVTLSGSVWTPFAVTLNIPNISGKVLGTNGNDYLQLNFWLSGGSDFNARTNSLGIQTINAGLWGIHIRKGVAPVEATNYYSPPPIWETEPACMRFYFQGFLPLRGVIGTPGTVARLGAPLQIPMRRSPDIIVSGTLFDGFGTDTLATLIANSSSFAAIEGDFATTGTHLGQGRAAVLLNPSTVIVDAEL